MTNLAHRLDPISVEDYLRGEESSPQRHEYIAGVVYAMSGGTVRHSAIASNVLVALANLLKNSRCRAFGSDLKIRIEMRSHTRFYYPDVAVVCQPGTPTELFHDEPTLIVEVLSESTRRTDLTEKREAYCTIPSLTHYIVIEQEAARAIVFERTNDDWQRVDYTDLKAVIPLPSLSVELKLSDIYDGVELEE